MEKGRASARLYRPECPIEPLCRNYAAAMKRLFTKVSGLAMKFDMDLELIDENGSFPGGIYEKLGDWSLCGYDTQQKKAKIVIADKAIASLSSHAIGGLMCSTFSRMLGLHTARMNSPVAFARLVKSAQEIQAARGDVLSTQYFPDESIAPFRVETMNIDYPRFGQDIVEFCRKYLAELAKKESELAETIKTQLSFASEL